MPAGRAPGRNYCPDAETVRDVGLPPDGVGIATAQQGKQLRKNLERPHGAREVYGVANDEIPSWTLETDPGDLVVWNFRTIHASFAGGLRRRLFSINFRDGAATPPPGQKNAK